MIKIQVLGQGMIPRDLGLAPRMEPFYADKMLIYTILQTPGLKVNYLHPENGRFFPMTLQNMQNILDKFKNAKYPIGKTSNQPTLKPHTPIVEKKPEEKKEETPKQQTPPAPSVPPVDPPKTVTPPQDQPKVVEEKTITPPTEVKEEVKKDEPKKEEPKAEEKKPEEKKEEKPAQTGGLKPVVGQGQNAQDKKDPVKK